MKIKRKNVERISGSLSVHFFDHFAGPYLSIMEKVEMGKNINLQMWNLFAIWYGFFLSFVYTSTKGMEKVQSSKKLVNQKICKWILNCHFKFWHNRRNGFLSEPDSKLNSNPFFILFIADLIYHLSLTPPGPHCTA